MKSIIPLFVVGMLVFSGVGVFSTSLESEEFVLEQCSSVMFSRPAVSSVEDFVSVEVKEASSMLRLTGAPLIPKKTMQFVLPFGSSVDDVSVEYLGSSFEQISGVVQPAAAPVIEGSSEVSEPTCNPVFYELDQYPVEEYQLRVSAGIVNGVRSTIVSVEVYPVIYHPEQSSLQSFEQIDVELMYSSPSQPVVFNDEFDLVIIAPELFVDELEPLVTHKNSIGTEAYILTVEEIEADFTQGVDEAENIKLAILDAVETFGVDYVLLVGGLVGQNLETWYVPVRYVSTPNEDAFLCDLYYADLYMIEDNETVFSSWDSNDDDRFGEWLSQVGRKDIIEAVPDVYVGRWACQKESEVTTMVEKTIAYESAVATESWFKRILTAGGDTYPDSGPIDEYEAEIDVEVTIGNMDGFEPVRLKASDGSLSGQASFTDAFSEGVGFVHCAGHANPSTLITHPPGIKAEKIEIMRMHRLSIMDFMWAVLYQGKGIAEALDILMKPVEPKLNNGEMLPIVLVGGCHNSQFNVSMKNIIETGFTHAYGYGIHGPNCWSWWLTVKKDGGSIATIGNSGYGMGIVGAGYPTGLDGWLYPRFFYNYNVNEYRNLGAAHAGAISDYISEFDINNDAEDRQMVEQWILLGDPSILPGGFE